MSNLKLTKSSATDNYSNHLTSSTKNNPLSIYDLLHRPLKDLRISVTDRCNFRCIYCMPKHIFGPNFKFIQHQDMLSFEEITRLTQCFVALGVTKIRLTGGEPLLRKDIESLVSSLSNIKTLSGSPLDLTMTTNGSALINKAQALFNAGLKRITLSLDAIDNDVFMKINGVAYPVDRILNAIEQALKIGFSPIKVNAVIRKGMNENQILPLVRYFRHTPIILRFIEYMDAGSTNGWNEHQIIPSAQNAPRRTGQSHHGDFVAPCFLRDNRPALMP